MKPIKPFSHIDVDRLLSGSSMIRLAQVLKSKKIKVITIDQLQALGESLMAPVDPPSNGKI